MKERAYNKLIQWLCRHTHITAGTIYTMLWRVPIESAELCVNEIREAQEKSGCYTEETYSKWLHQTAEWKAMTEKYEHLSNE